LPSGAFAIGRLAIKRLAVGSGHIKRLCIDKLEVDRLKVRQRIPSNAPTPSNWSL
jgi:hypothetical protein